MGDPSTQGLDHTSGFDASDDRLWGSTAFVGAIAAHSDVTKIHATDFHLYTNLAWPRGRGRDFEHTQYFRATSLSKSYSLHGSLLGCSHFIKRQQCTVCRITRSRPTSSPPCLEASLDASGLLGHDVRQCS